MKSKPSTLRAHGGYRRLRSFQVTEIVYDATAHGAAGQERRLAILGLLGLSGMQGDRGAV